MKTTGRVNGIISNIVIVKADGPVGQNEICYVWTGDTKMMAEVIKVIGDAAYVQVFDSTRGLKIGDRVEFEGHMLEVTLAPGLLSRNYDGLQNDLEKMDGLFIARGSITDPVDYDAEWEFSPLAKAGDTGKPDDGDKPSAGKPNDKGDKGNGLSKTGASTAPIIALAALALLTGGVNADPYGCSPHGCAGSARCGATPWPCSPHR